MAAPVVLITGAAHRLGAHTAETLHGRGWNVVIHYRSRQEQARQLIDKLNRERADSATSVQADLTNPEDLARLAKTACNHWQRLDGLVNNASVFYPNPTENATEDDWQGIMGANLKAPFFLLQHCLPALKKSSGAVVNLIDIYSESPSRTTRCTVPARLASPPSPAPGPRTWLMCDAPFVTGQIISVDGGRSLNM